jgi:hypothetical protein
LLVKPTPRNVNLGSGRFAMLNKERDISGRLCIEDEALLSNLTFIEAFCRRVFRLSGST